MKATFLVEHINQLIKKTTINKIGEIAKMQIIPREHQSKYNDELSLLINNYKMEDVSIGKIDFLGKYQITENYLAFAEIDMDLIATDLDNGEISMLDHDMNSYVMMKCAKNRDAFLELLIPYINFVFDKLSKQVNRDKIDLNPLIKMAGGDAYKNFISFLFS